MVSDRIGNDEHCLNISAFLHGAYRENHTGLHLIRVSSPEQRVEQRAFWQKSI